MKVLIVALSMCALAGCASSSYRFAVWPDPDVLPVKPTPQQIQAAGAIEHPCGWVRDIDVDRLPPPGEAGHVSGTESVVEFDSNGAVLRRWSIPVDAFPTAVDGARLEFDYGGQRFLVDADGRLREVANRDRSSTPLACPASIDAEFRGSEFLMCARMPDLGTDAVRNLAFEGVCT